MPILSTVLEEYMMLLITYHKRSNILINNLKLEKKLREMNQLTASMFLNALV